MIQLNKNIEYEQFIQFGGLGNETTRREVVYYIIKKLSGTKSSISIENNIETSLFHQAIDEIISNKEISKLTIENEQITKEITIDFLKWIKQFLMFGSWNTLTIIFYIKH